MVYNWIRQLIASEQPTLEKFTITDPSAVGEKVRSITLALTPSTEDSPTSVVSLYWTDADAKVYEHQFRDPNVAKEIFDSMRRDLFEASELTKLEKLPEAAALVDSLLKRYEVHTDNLVDGTPEPITTTMASKKEADEQLPNPLVDEIDEPTHSNVGSPEWLDTTLKQLESDYASAHYVPDQTDILYDMRTIAEDETGFAHSVDDVKTWFEDYYKWKRTQKHSSLSKLAKITFQNIFFSTPEEAVAYQEQMKKLNPPSTDVNKTIPKLDPAVDTGEEAVPGAEDEISDSSLSYEDFEKNKADEQKLLTKRIEREVKDQVESALEQKVATKFSKNDKELVDAMRGVGRTWEEISDYMVKNLKYKKEDVAMFLDQLKDTQEPAITENPLLKDRPEDEAPLGEEPILEQPKPEAPRPPENLVSPETHDKLIQEVDEIQKKDMQEIAKLDGEIQKKADEPLETTPSTGGESESPFGADVTDQMQENPVEPPVPIDQEERSPELDNLKPNDRVYVMGDYETGETGFGGVYLSQYKTDGETYAVIDRGSNDLVEIPLRNVKKAFHLSVIKKLAQRKKERGDKSKAELAAINADLQTLAEELKKTAAELIVEDSIEVETSSKEREQQKKREFNLSLPILGYGILLGNSGRVHFDDPTDTRVRIVEQQGQGSLVVPERGKGKSYVNTGDIQIIPKEHYFIEATKKTAAPFEQPTPQTEAPAAPQAEDPIKFKPMQRAPDNTKDQETVTPSPELAGMMRELNEVTAKLDEMNQAVKTFIAKIEAEKQQRLKEFETKVQPEKLRAIQDQLTQRIGAVMKAMENKTVEVNEFVYRLIQETKVTPHKISDAEILQRVSEKIAGAAELIESIKNGAKSKDVKKDEITLYRSPKPLPKKRQKSMLIISCRDIEAGVLDELSGMYDDMVAALKLLMEADEMLESSVGATAGKV